jgi:uncharacterized membrane protein
MKSFTFRLIMLVVVTVAAPNARGDGWKFSGGTFTTISAPGAASSTAPSGINDAGQIVGTSTNGSFIDTGGTFSTLSIPGVDPTATIEASGINDLGEVVGTLGYTVGSNPGYLASGFILSGPLLTTILVTPPYETYANGINNLGQVVGISCAAPVGLNSGPCQSFRDSGGVFTPVIDPDATTGTSAYAINDLGQIVGIYGTAFDVRHRH